MRHPTIGPITIRYEALALPGDEEQTLFIYTTDPGSPSHDNMRLLALSVQHGGNAPDARPTGASRRSSPHDAMTDPA
jgi:hypothetical protein